jgi:uncharacterized protein YqgC (DUF456 family)
MEIFVVIIMVLVLLLVIVPVVPVAAVEWSIAMVFGALTMFERLTIPAALVITLFMIIGSTSQYWAPFIGIKGKQMSCLSILAFFLGAMVGTGVIPIPIIGTLVGGILAVIAVEFLNTKDWRIALTGGKTAFATFLIGMGMELVFSILIIVTFVFSVSTTG